MTDAGKKKIIFVDDEPNVLKALGRSLRSTLKTNEWEMFFAESGPEALKIMETQPIDIIISDMRMPHMTGVELLGTVMKLYPKTIRFILSGYSDRDLIINSIGSTHQFLSKPCDPRELEELILRAFQTRNILQGEHLLELVTKIDSLPALPETYKKIMALLKTPKACAQSVGELIAEDVGMSAKILQLVNSSFFGLRQQITAPTQAVSLLGVDLVKSLTLMIDIFAIEPGKQSAIPIPELWQHSLLVAKSAQAVARTLNADKKTLEDAFMAGLLHDIGKLILSTHLPNQYTETIDLAVKESIPLIDAEREVLGATHCEVGAFLLGLWGFSDLMIESALYHHSPRDSNIKHFTSLAAVHIANSIAIQHSPKTTLPSVIDKAYLTRINVLHKLDEWTKLCEKILIIH